MVYLVFPAGLGPLEQMEHRERQVALDLLDRREMEETPVQLDNVDQLLVT